MEAETKHWEGERELMETAGEREKRAKERASESTGEKKKKETERFRARKRK